MLEHFIKFSVSLGRWSNGERDFISPWALEPIDPSKRASGAKGLKIEPHELAECLYQSCPLDWPNGDRDSECDRIAEAFRQVLLLCAGM